LLQLNDSADFIIVRDLTNFQVEKTYIDGILVANQGNSLIETNCESTINHFNCEEKKASDFTIPYQGEKEIPVIEALEGQLITNKILASPTVQNNSIVSNVSEDVLKIVVVNRYQQAPIAKSFIKNIGIKEGAIASSVAHDSHNIVAVGVDDDSLCRAINAIIQNSGGICAVNHNTQHILPLPVAGLMSNQNGYEIAKAYTTIDSFTKKELGSTLNAPFMTLSFMALLVIPHLKLSDKGLFDGDRFMFIG